MERTQNINKDSEPAKHLREYHTHAPNDTRTRKNIEASVIALKRPSLNDQLDSQRLILFRNNKVVFLLFDTEHLKVL